MPSELWTDGGTQVCCQKIYKPFLRKESRKGRIECKLFPVFLNRINRSVTSLQNMLSRNLQSLFQLLTFHRTSKISAVGISPAVNNFGCSKPIIGPRACPTFAACSMVA